MIQPLFDKNQIFRNMYEKEKSIKTLIGINDTHSEDYVDVCVSYLCDALGVNHQEFIDEYINFKKSLDKWLKVWYNKYISIDSFNA